MNEPSISRTVASVKNSEQQISVYDENIVVLKELVLYVVQDLTCHPL